MRVPVGMKEDLKRKLKGLLTGEEIDELSKGSSEEEVKEAFSGGLASMRSMDHSLAKAATSECLNQGVQIKALLDDVERLTREVEEWKGKFERAVEATQDQLAGYWKRECLKYKAELEKKGEFSQ